MEGFKERIAPDSWLDGPHALNKDGENEMVWYLVFWRKRSTATLVPDT